MFNTSRIVDPQAVGDNIVNILKMSTANLLAAAKKIQPHLHYIARVIKHDPEILCARVSVVLPDYDEYLKMVGIFIFCFPFPIR